MDYGLDGLISGMATSELIEQLLVFEKLPIYRYENDITETNLAKDAWRDINSRLKNLEAKLADLKLSATFNSRIASSSDEKTAAAKAGNSAAEGRYELVISRMATAHRIASDRMADSTSALGLSGNIEINGKTLEISESFSLKDIRDAINGTEDIGVSASIINDTLVLEARETGVEIDFGGGSGNILQELGLLNPENVLQEARSAELTINGIAVTSTSNTIDKAVEGLTFEIKGEGNVVIEVSRDTEKAVKALQDFVNQYNSLMSFIDSKTYYNPDSGDRGILQGDTTIMRLETRIRQLIMDSIETGGEITHLSQLGISIDRDGVMSFDTAKFEEILKEKSEDVVNFFSGAEEEMGFSGMAVRLDTYLDLLLQSNTGLIPEKIEAFDNRIKYLNDRIEEAERRVEMARERYRAQFAAMEEALAQMQQQYNWMLNQLLGLANMNIGGGRN
ncbi:MAG: flagellar filament capping protein FliD [Halanaerobiaceae bacterium]|jgi:flagellar hook-associated protein 2|nr:flagellar filament capping protein FliD [Halanaerobiaceae bacterium]